MKKLMMVASLCVMLGIVGCGNDAEGWYPISGGYINLRNVHVITTCFAVNYQGEPITRESIALSKKQVSESKDVPRITTAWIKFDDFTVVLPKEAKSKKEALRLLDYYLDVVEGLKLPVK